MFLSSTFLLLLSNFSYCVSKNYSEYTLYRGIPINEDHLMFLSNLTEAYKAKYWKPPGLINKTVEFIIGPDTKKSFLRAADDKDIVLTTVIEDVQIAFNKQTVKEYTRRKMETFDWKSYYRLEDIYNWMKDLERSYPKAMKIIRIGKTFEGRDILAARISHPGSEKRSTVIVEGGVHAREWIAPAVVTYFMHEVLSGPKSMDQQLRTISNLYEFIFVPVLNPDGYEYTHTDDRVWRKNRAYGHGVDINRNFGIAFGTVGVNFEENDETYCGKTAFSEKESYAMAKFLEAKRNTMEYYLAFHSYGQFIILPYTYSKSHDENFNEMKAICDVAANQIKRRHNTVYTVGTAYECIGYISSGVSGCWAKKSFGIPYVATFELPDKEQYGFALPPDKILPTCKKTMDGLLHILQPKSPQFRSPLRHSSAKGLEVWALNLLELLMCIIVRFN